MRKLFHFAMIVAGFGMILTSCNLTDVGNPPLVTVSPSDPVDAKPGAVVSYQVVVSSDTDLKSVEVKAKHDATVFASADTTFAAGVQSAVVNFSVTLPSNLTAGSVVVLEFTATNTSTNKMVSTTINIQAGEINTYTAVIMSDLENPDGSSFYSVEDNNLMTLNQAIASSAAVDLIYYYGATNKATLCAPADQGVRAFTDSHGAVVVDRLTTKNNTKLAAVTVSVTDFNAITDDGPIVAKTPASTLTAATNLAKDQVIYCETVTGKKALVLVKDITGGQGTSYITIEVKVQK